MAEAGDSGRLRSSDIPADAVRTDTHVVDQLIAERGQKIVESWAWPLLRPLLYRVLHYDDAVRMADALAPLGSAAAMDFISGLLALDLDVVGLEHVPRQGAFVVAANHPTGIADGVAVFDALKAVRRDIAIFTNRDAVRVNPRLADVLIPVEWREEHRNHTKTKETLRLSSRAFREERAVVLFPSGRIAYWKDGRLNERPWQISAVTLARKHAVPIVPMHVESRNSGLFYWFAQWNTELRDMTVFHELLNKRGKTFRIRIGRPIPTGWIAEGDALEVTQRLQAHTVEALARDPGAAFAP